MWLAECMAALIGIVDYFSPRLIKSVKHFHAELISASAGVAITYLFMDLFPRFANGLPREHNYLFLTVLLGFGLLHIVEKFLYQHYSKSKLRKELAIEGSVVTAIYHFFIGIVLVSLITQDPTEGVLFFLPIFLYTSLSTLHVHSPKYKSIRFVVALATLAGVLFAQRNPINPLIGTALLGVIIGALCYTVTRHSLPTGRAGKPFYFVLGALAYVILLKVVGAW
jgi:hypothetical protein|tara:strand:+ start:1415 stop:2086 length:672 start_codon:yes stop_codon:yes gene_type:complete